MSDWKIFQGTAQPHYDIKKLPEPPSWRSFRQTLTPEQNLESINFVEPSQDQEVQNQSRGATFRLAQGDKGKELLNLVNAALYLRRPLLITGKPGTGKTAIAYAIAYELNLGPVLLWPITGRSSLQDGLYRYDAIARLQEVQAQKNKDGEVKNDSTNIGNYIQLGPVGTAFLPYRQPRVLLIDEVDKSDINLPNDLLNLFEEGAYEIPELARLSKTSSAQSEKSKLSEVEVEVRTSDSGTARIRAGRVRCYEFPCIILTSNGERDFPPAFMRRCLQITMPDPQKEALIEMVKAHLKDVPLEKIQVLVDNFVSRKKGVLAPDQLLNVVYLLTRQFSPNETDEKTLINQLLTYLDSTGSP